MSKLAKLSFTCEANKKTFSYKQNFQSVLITYSSWKQMV